MLKLIGKKIFIFFKFALKVIVIQTCDVTSTHLNRLLFLDFDLGLSFGLFLWLHSETQSYEPVHEISNVVYATSKASDQPAHTRSLIIAFVSRLSSL